MKTIVLILIIALGLGVSLRAKRERTVSETEIESLAKEYAASRQHVTMERQRLEIARDARASVHVVSRTAAPETANSDGKMI